MCDVLTATISDTRWFMLGVALHVEQHQLQRIKSNYRDAQDVRMTCYIPGFQPEMPHGVD